MKKNISLIGQVILFLLALGCHEKRKLSGYYDIYERSDKYPVGAFNFNQNGQCFYYKYDRSTGERELFNIDDVIENNSWSFINDTLKIRGYRYKVVWVSDTLLLTAIDNSKSARLVKSNMQDP